MDLDGCIDLPVRTAEIFLVSRAGISEVCFPLQHAEISANAVRAGDVANQSVFRYEQ